jgi:hypothetical protein
MPHETAKQLNAMSAITLALTVEELQLLTSLASDQLFRREFIDPKMPGHKTNLSEIHLAKSLINRLKSEIHPGVERISVLVKRGSAV